MTATPTPGPWVITLKAYDAGGALLRSLPGGMSSLPLRDPALSAEAWDPAAGPLGLSEGGWSLAFDGRDADGMFFAAGAYLLVLESSSSGQVHSASKSVTVLRAAQPLLAALAAPNPAGKGVQVVELRWQPLTQELWGEVFNQAGERVAQLGVLRGGRARWELKDAANGVYLISLKQPGLRHPRLLKMALAR